ncbi:MAG: HutD-family protein [Kaistia sp. SCN 65-12]|nr:MAG: HutD-family protein [Kaistia sp. SCN 65-12]
MRLLRAGSYREMPWKNGGGTTTEIAVFPAGAGLDGFDWRVSMARVESGGPFSLFAGVDRTLAVIEGDGIRLTVGGAVPVALDKACEPLSFAADVETHAVLAGGPVRDLNVMTRRGRARHSMRRLALCGHAEIPIAGDVLLVFCAEGDIAVSGKEAMRLGPHDTLLVDRDADTLRLVAGRPSVALLIVITAGDHAS